MKKIILLLGLLMLTQLSFAQVPDVMSFQGYLTDNTTGIPIDGAFNIQFDIFDQEFAGSVLWTEMHVAVPVAKGIYNVILGSQGSPVLILFDGSYWLEVTINGSTLVPRVPLTTSSYSFSARSVFGGANVFPGSGNVGIGNVNPGASLDVKGEILTDTLSVTSVVQNTDLGNANVTAVAYGNIDMGGAINIPGSTNNFTVVPAGIGIYDINWTNSLLTNFDDAVVVVNSTEVGMPRFASWTGFGPTLRIFIFDLAGAPVDAGFSFVVFKP